MLKVLLVFAALGQIGGPGPGGNVQNEKNRADCIVIMDKCINLGTQVGDAIAGADFQETTLFNDLEKLRARYDNYKKFNGPNESIFNIIEQVQDLYTVGFNNFIDANVKYNTALELQTGAIINYNDTVALGDDNASFAWSLVYADFQDAMYYHIMAGWKINLAYSDFFNSKQAVLQVSYILSQAGY